MIDITDESYESDLSEEESNKLLLMCGHAVGLQLSPAAQAVLDAYWKADPESTEHTDAYEVAGIAAALRAAADQVVPFEPLHSGDERWILERDTRQICRRKLLAIAAELEN